jgi:small conductance mechanosensitive channel
MNYRFLLLITTLLWMPAIYSEELVDAGAEIQVTNAPDDQAIENRLTDILNVIESYEDVEVTVDSGVVILSGNVSSARAGRDLVALASRVEGVIYVQNRLNELMDISTRVQPTTQKIEAMLSSLIRSLPIFWWLSSLSFSFGCSVAGSVTAVYG